MALGGTGAVMGDAMASAVGAGASAGGFFQTVGAVIADWGLTHVQVQPGAMAASGGAVSGLGSFTVFNTSALELGTALADALAIPATAADTRAKWVVLAGAIITHFENFGQANGSGLTSGTPCGGLGTLQWTSLVFVPPLATQLDVSDVVAAALLELFGTAMLTHIQTNAQIAAVSLTGPPLSAPTNGAVTGTGTII